MVDVAVRGVPAAVFLVTNLPGRLVGPMFKGSVDELLKQGISLMQTHVRELVYSDKSTGELADSIEGLKIVESVDADGNPTGKVTVIIGSKVKHAGYAAREIGWSVINRSVFIKPAGRWVFVGNRPPIPAHPFLEYTMFDLMNGVIPTALSDNFTAASVKLQEEVERFRGGEAFGQFWNKLGGGTPV